MPGAEAGAGEGREARALLLIAAVALCALCGGGSLLLFYVAPLDQPAPPAHLSDISSSPPSTPKYSSFSRLCKYINCSGLAPTTKTILLWNSPTLDDNLGYGPSKGISIFQDVSCRPNDCFMTANLSLMPVVAYDAVVVSNIPPVDAPVSKERRPEQRYIFYMPKPGSSPLTALYAYEEKLPRYYNWTMSYRLDSDIIFPRGQVVPGPGPRGWLTPADPPPAPRDVVPGVTRPPRGPSSSNPVRVAWFNEHCERGEELDKLVAGLMLYMRVDVMGKCPPFVWPRARDPLRALSAHYDFFLVMGDLGCRHYVTEKLYDYLQLDVLSVVYGSGHFSALFPPHSFIDASTFLTVDHVAAYLLYLAQHPDEYAKFFWWKSHYSVVLRPPDNLCRLCEQLHRPLPPKGYVSAWQFWHAHGLCVAKKDSNRQEQLVSYRQNTKAEVNNSQ